MKLYTIVMRMGMMEAGPYSRVVRETLIICHKLAQTPLGASGLATNEVMDRMPGYDVLEYRMSEVPTELIEALIVGGSERMGV